MSVPDHLLEPIDNEEHHPDCPVNMPPYEPCECPELIEADRNLEADRRMDAEREG